MNQEAFIRQLIESPREKDNVTWLAFADWLEEQGDERCNLVRTSLVSTAAAFDVLRQLREDDPLREALAAREPLIAVAIDPPRLAALMHQWMDEHPATETRLVTFNDGHPETIDLPPEGWNGAVARWFDSHVVSDISLQLRAGFPNDLPLINFFSRVPPAIASKLTHIDLSTSPDGCSDDLMCALISGKYYNKLKYLDIGAYQDENSIRFLLSTPSVPLIVGPHFPVLEQLYCRDIENFQRHASARQLHRRIWQAMPELQTINGSTVDKIFPAARSNGNGGQPR